MGHVVAASKLLPAAGNTTSATKQNNVEKSNNFNVSQSGQNHSMTAVNGGHSSLLAGASLPHINTNMALNGVAAPSSTTFASSGAGAPPSSTEP